MHRRPDAETPTKYEHQLPSYVEDFFLYFLKVLDGEQLEEWQMGLVEQLREGIVDQMREQYKSSSHSRKLFVSMNKENVWESEADKTMRLTRRNIATFENAFIVKLDSYIKEVNRGIIAPIRDELLGIVRAVNASEEETSAVQAFCSGETFYFEDVAQHLVEQDAWQAELFQRLPIIRYVRQREEFLLKLVKFEETNRNSSARKERISTMNENAKFRTRAATTLEESTAFVRKLIDDYQTTYQKAFELKGIVYQHKLEEQEACVANVRTNFSGFSRAVLAFLDTESDTIEQEVVSTAAAELLNNPDFLVYEMEDLTLEQ